MSVFISIKLNFTSNFLDQNNPNLNNYTVIARMSSSISEFLKPFNILVVVYYQL